MTDFEVLHREVVFDDGDALDVWTDADADRPAPATHLSARRVASRAGAICAGRLVRGRAECTMFVLAGARNE